MELENRVVPDSFQNETPGVKLHQAFISTKIGKINSQSAVDRDRLTAKSRDVYALNYSHDPAALEAHRARNLTAITEV